MGEFFITKIANIKSKLDGISPSHLPSTSEPDLASEPSDIVLSDFQCQTVDAIRDMITSGKKKSCILDPKPVTLLSACLDPLLPVITNMKPRRPWRIDRLVVPPLDFGICLLPQ
ncbi:hypothetical protein P5673_030000 [Acropora cervicornis]|uniref:Uncharacterized protein n=1 Tax=Acropora cervicornis TaxID=6130 RepID=A0AAD9UTU3_ACRCE|nr:hypothetical protein P5673_030000 [Acropora cervicornis]